MPPLKLVPRMHEQGYLKNQVDDRRAWTEAQTGTCLTHVGSGTLNTEQWRGNIENPIGVAQIPLGIAGPLQVNGTHAKGTFYIPLATTEGALVRSYERGMVCLTRAGGATVRVHQDENRIAPVFFFEDTAAAYAFTKVLPTVFEDIRAAAQATTSHGCLLRLECHPLGRQVIVNFCYYTGDAQGMNMIVKATEAGCRWIMAHITETTKRPQRYYIFSGMNSEKRASGFLMNGGKGKKVVAGVHIPAALVQAYLHATPAKMVDIWHHTMLGHVQANAVGYSGHYANGLTAMFIACGQDVANVANACVGITNFEETEAGDLYASVTLPSLTVATVGGGTALGTSRECLELLGCSGNGHAAKLAEIMGAALLAGELSMGAAIASGEFVDAHETYGRNRPQ